MEQWNNGMIGKENGFPIFHHSNFLVSFLCGLCGGIASFLLLQSILPCAIKYKLIKKGR
jgi:hypothetical protein